MSTLMWLLCLPTPLTQSPWRNGEKHARLTRPGGRRLSVRPPNPTIHNPSGSARRIWGMHQTLAKSMKHAGGCDATPTARFLPSAYIRVRACRECAFLLSSIANVPPGRDRIKFLLRRRRRQTDGHVSTQDLVNIPTKAMTAMLQRVLKHLISILFGSNILLTFLLGMGSIDRSGFLRPCC